MNNKGLVEYAKKCLALGNNSVYVYGTFGQKLTTALCDSKRKQYPNINTAYRTTIYKQLCDGKHYGFDCVGLIKSYLWGGYGTPSYNANQDVSANGMYERAKVKGNIGTMDKSKIGLLVQMNGHIGIYIGNNEVIECTPATRFATQSHKMGGVCKTRLSDRNWTHWLECPFIKYDYSGGGGGGGTVTKNRVKTLQQALNTCGAGLAVDGSYGPATTKAVSKYWNYKTTIKWVQQNLNELGYNAGPVDGSRGPKTKDATRRYQKANGLSVDGSAGPATIKSISKKA